MAGEAGRLPNDIRHVELVGARLDVFAAMPQAASSPLAKDSTGHGLVMTWSRLTLVSSVTWDALATRLRGEASLHVVPMHWGRFPRAHRTRAALKPHPC